MTKPVATHQKYLVQGKYQWLTPVILATQEANQEDQGSKPA
jgi:hypothetical protein